jgi:hypothetical protein
MAAPLTELFERLLRVILTSPQVVHLQLILLVTKIFHSLNAQDLPEFFEARGFPLQFRLIATSRGSNQTTAS